MNVIDTIAPTLPGAPRQGRRLEDRSRRARRSTPRNAEIVETSPGFVTRFLSTILDPNLLSLLFLAGIVGIGFEIFHPGVVLPGALGAVSLLLALFGLAVLPTSWTGLGLVLLGVLLLGLDTYLPSHGALTAVGADRARLRPRDALPRLVRPLHDLDAARRHADGPDRRPLGVGDLEGDRGAAAPVLVGPEEIVGMQGVVREGGLVQVHGELWKAKARRAAPHRPARRGRRARRAHPSSAPGLSRIVS